MWFYMKYIVRNDGDRILFACICMSLGVATHLFSFNMQTKIIKRQSL